MAELLEVGAFQLMELWGELLEAWHGVNGFGGDTAELYAYRFQPNPHGRPHEVDQKARRQLHALLLLFQERCECDIYVDGVPLREMNLNQPFDHRTHVRIEHPWHPRPGDVVRVKDVAEGDGFIGQIVDADKQFCRVRNGLTGQVETVGRSLVRHWPERER